MLLYLIISIPKAANDGNDDKPNHGTGSGPNEDSWIDSIIVVALGVLPLMVVVPLWTISIEITAFPGAVLIVAVLVVSHYLFCFDMDRLIKIR